MSRPPDRLDSFRLLISFSRSAQLDEYGNRDPFADLDVVSAHSPEPEAESAPGRNEEEDRLRPESHVADPERDSELDLPQAPSSTDDAKAVDAIDFAEEVSPQATQPQRQEDAPERPDMSVADDIAYTDSDSDDDEEVLALLSPRKPAPAGPSKAAKATRRSRVEAVAQDESAESSSPAVRRSSRLSTTPAATPAPPTRQASTSKRTRAELRLRKPQLLPPSALDSPKLSKRAVRTRSRLSVSDSTDTGITSPRFTVPTRTTVSLRP